MNQPPVVLITGASDGLGLALARSYHAAGARLVLVGRRPINQLDQKLFTSPTYIQTDITHPDATELIYSLLKKQGIHQLDLLIHCAGVGWYGPIANQPPESIDHVLQTNLYAPIALTHTLMPFLLAAHGQIVLIGSIAAGLPVPEYAVYAASKAALAGFARSLRVEMQGRMSVQVIHPGAVRTAMHARSGMPVTQRRWQRFPTPERVAQQIVCAIERKQPVTVLGARNRLAWWAGRNLGWLVERVRSMH